MYLSNEEMKTHLYQEDVDVISGGDDALMTAAIDAATQEAKGYLSAYDREVIFAASGETRNMLLLMFVKDIAAWHFLVICNAGTEYKIRQDRYERAIAWLKSVQKGDVTPDLPVTETAIGVIKFGSNEQKGQHF
ncbi:MAG: phage protein Gp36 family protein [Bacteroidales bacterium]